MALQFHKKYSNRELNRLLHCQIEGGIRTGKYNGQKVILAIFNFFHPSYPDSIKDSIINFCGVGRTGDQDPHSARNRKLFLAKSRHLPIYLFFCLSSSQQSPKQYSYGGQVRLISDQIKYHISRDEAGNPRRVIIFKLAYVNNSAKDRSKHESAYRSAKEYRIKHGRN